MSSIYRIDERSITEHLLELAQRGNKPFTERLHPGIPGVLGVRLPDLRALAKHIVRSGTAPAYLEEAERTERSPEEDFMEARILHGFVLGMLPVDDFPAYLEHLRRWVQVIHSWSVCDSFSLPQSKKLLREHGQELWDFFVPYLQHSEEYRVRFGVVALMQYFIDAEHIGELLPLYLAVKHEGYYVQMALAWALAECYTFYPEETHPYLADRRFAPWVHNKAIQKICESRRIDPDTKALLKTLRVKAG